MSIPSQTLPSDLLYPDRYLIRFQERERAGESVSLGFMTQKTPE